MTTIIKTAYTRIANEFDIKDNHDFKTSGKRHHVTAREFFICYMHYEMDYSLVLIAKEIGSTQKTVRAIRDRGIEKIEVSQKTKELYNTVALLVKKDIESLVS